MRINQKILSIPPYISTTWKNVSSLHVESRHSTLVLVILLATGTRIEIPGMDPGIIKAIFAAHASFVEVESSAQRHSKSDVSKDPFLSFGLPIKSDLLEAFDSLGPLLQHNAERSQDPDLPKGLLQKVASLAKTLGLKDSDLIPQSEPHCNCMHCQIAKALKQGMEEITEGEEEVIITEEDLRFRTWDISKTGDKLYSVSNPLDTQEQFSVYLGDPVGCTCGNPHCEHIRAVLNS